MRTSQEPQKLTSKGSGSWLRKRLKVTWNESGYDSFKVPRVPDDWEMPKRCNWTRSWWGPIRIFLNQLWAVRGWLPALQSPLLRGPIWLRNQKLGTLRGLRTSSKYLSGGFLPCLAGQKVLEGHCLWLCHGKLGVTCQARKRSSRTTIVCKSQPWSSIYKSDFPKYCEAQPLPIRVSSLEDKAGADINNCFWSWGIKMRKEAKAIRSYGPVYKTVWEFLGIKLVRETGNRS